MELVIITTGETITREQIEADWMAANPGHHFRLKRDLSDVDLSDFGAAKVEPVDPPETSAGQVAERDGIEQYAPGLFRWKWKVRARTAPELAAAKEAKKAEIRDLRWQKEIGGATFNGMPIRTDDASVAKIHRAVSLFDKDPTLLVVDFEAQPGVWIEFEKAPMDALGVFVGRHVQQCFSHSKTLMDGVDALSSFAALAAFDIEAGWPE